MSRLSSVLRALIILAVVAIGIRAQASEIPGLAGGNRGWVAMLIEDHAGMSEVVWDGAFTDPEAAGPFKKDHRYALVTKGSTGLVDLGCWDQAWPGGGGWTAPAPMMAVTLTRDGSGAILTFGGKSTWLPVAASYAGKGTPTATLRGAYLNWLLANRGTSPSIPRETRWQRLRRGAEAIVRDLLTRSGNQPEFRVVGIGTSGRLLIPPGEGLQAGLNAVARMEPSDSGSMPGALNRALETMQKLRASGACEPGIVLPVGDGWVLDGGCAAGRAYESSSGYAAMLATIRAVCDTGEAELWAWSVDGPRAWSKAFAAEGVGRCFSGDAVADLDAAIKIWMGRHGQPLQLALTFDQPALTRVAQVTLSIQSSHGLLSAVLNGQPLQITGLETKVPLTLNEGVNTFTVSATDLCGGQAQASATITLDTIPPHITLNSVPPALTNQTTLTLQGRVDDSTATLTLDGQPVAMDPQGGFSVPAPLLEGPNTFALVATDPAGNSGRQDIFVVRDTIPPVIALSSAPPSVTKADLVDLTGSVNELISAMTLNGAPLPFSGQGFSAKAFLSMEGTNTFELTATDMAGNVGRLSVQIQRDTTPPVVRFETPQDGFTTNQASVVVRGTVDDLSARLILMGKDTPLDAQGRFEATITASKEGPLAVRAEASDPAGNTGKGTVYVKFDFTPPTLAWVNPTPTEGATLSTSLVPAAVVVNEAALTSINGRRMELEPSENASMPFLARTELDVQEGRVLLRATAVDGAGNSASIERTLDVGLTQPRIVLESPSLDGAQRFSTANPGVTLVGHVEAPDLVKPLVFTVNGQVRPLTEEGRFNTPVALGAGLNSFVLVATTKLGQSATQNLTVLRTSEDVPADAAASVQIDWPQNGFASGVTPILVKGRVNKASVQVVLAGQSVSVDPQTLQFSGNVALTPGANRIQVVGTDAGGRTATAEVQGTYVAPGFAKYSWEAPVDGMQSATRTVRVSGQADQPGILSVMVNGVPMALSGDGPLGRFNGEVGLSSTGRNTLLMEVRTLAGETRTEKRDVIFEPELPRIRLMAPDSARPGDTIPIQVSPEAGTKLLKADLTWNGRFLATVTEPFGAVSALVPADAVVGSRINLEAVGTGTEGATVTARAYVTVFGSGALMIEAYDDRLGLPLADKTAIAFVEGGESQTLDEHGRAALATALPQNWIKVSKAGFTPVWRSAALQVGGIQSLVDARLTPMEKSQDMEASGFTGEFAGGALKLSIPAGAPGKLSATPLSAQGLPGLLPLGWSAVSAWWIQMDGTSMPPQGMAALTLPAATPALPADARYVWARWDEFAHVWMALAAGLPADGLANLSTPSAGGYALLMADSGATAPPTAVVGSVLAGYEGSGWRDGIKASGSVDPSLMPTVDAIRGARATAIFGLAFEGLAPLPSGVPIQADVVESYALLDAAVIEPDGFSQDVVASRWMLEVVDGKPVLTGAGDGLGLRLPIHMSRSFSETELVEGRIFVGFYHDGVQVAQSGSELLGASGGVVSRDGVNVSFASGSLSGTTLVRLGVDGGDASSLWPELAGKGTLAKSFSVDIVGTLLSGLGLSVDALDLPETARPVVLQRRVVQGERLVVAVGELRKSGTSWVLVTPTGGNAVLEGGSFAVLVPTLNWDWISGTTMLPSSTAQPLMQNLGVKARMMPLKASAISPLSSSADVAVADVVVDGGFLLAASGATGAFAVPVWIPADAAAVSIKGERRDLGITGGFSALVPSTGNTLRLATVPFRVLNAVPANGAVAPVGSVVMLMLSGPADLATIPGAKLFKEVEATTTSLQAMASAPATKTDTIVKVEKSKTGKAKPARKAPKRRPSKAEKRALGLSVAPALVEIPVRRSLSQDGKTVFLIPEQPLELSSTYRILANGLLNLAGEAAPTFESRFQTTAVAPLSSEVDFSRIKLSYPDESFNVTVTIPEGALPPWAMVEIEANGMGSYANGTMLDKGDLTFTIKAALGERLKIRVQLKDGRVFEGYLSRYESNDGSGRVTLGVDGGRIDAVDGSGAFMVLPPGALDAPAELSLSFSQELPAELDPTLAAYKDKVAGRLQLTADREVTLNLRPKVQIPAPANASTAQHSDGLGAYAIFDKVAGFEDDGTPATWFEFGDTAALEGTNLVSKGGLPVPPEFQTTLLQGLAPIANTMGAQRGFRLAAPPASAQPPNTKARLSLAQPMAQLASYSGFGGLFGILDMFLIDSGPHYVSGRADIKVGSNPLNPAVGAFIFFSQSGGSSLKREGQMLQRTDAAGSYFLASFLTDELVRGGGQIMGIDPDFGTRAFSGTTFLGPGGIFGSYYVANKLHFVVTAEDTVDRLPPYVELKLLQGGKVIDADFAEVGAKVEIRARARDNRAGNLAFSVSINGQACKLGSETSSGGMAQRSGTMDATAEGVRRIDVVVTDASGNKAQMSRTIHILKLTTGDPETTDLTVTMTPETNVGVDEWIKLAFTKSVKIPDGGVQVSVDGTALLAPYVVRKGSITDLQRVIYVAPKGAWVRGKLHTLSLQAEGQAVQALQFRVQDVIALGSASISARPTGALAALGNRVFVAVQTSQGAKIEVFERVQGTGQEPQLVSVGVFAPTATSGFYGQDITCMKAFRRVPMGSAGRRDLLLVSTTPALGDDNHQGVLWAFNLCDESVLQDSPVPAQVSPQFAVSLGPGSSGYSPSLDQRDGLIVVGRLSSSVLLISAASAYEGWFNMGFENRNMVNAPAGANQASLMQSFYLGNPEGSVFPAHWGVGILGSLSAGSDEVPVVVSSGYVGVTRNSLPMDGLPLSIHGWAAGRQAQLPYVPLESGNTNSPDARAWPGPLYPMGQTGGVNYRVFRVMPWPDAQVSDANGSNSRTANLSLGVSRMPSTTGAGNSLVVMEYRKPTPDAPLAGQVKGVWPSAGERLPAGNAGGFELIGSNGLLSMDSLTGHCTVGYQAGGITRTLVLNLTRPDRPTIAADLGEGWLATIWNGVAYQVQNAVNVDGAGVPTNGYRLVAKRVAVGVSDEKLGGCGSVDGPYNECDGSANPELRILSVVPNGQGSTIKIQNRPYGGLPPFRAAVISIPRPNQTNVVDEVPSYLVTLRRPASFGFRGLCLSLSGNGNDTQLMKEQLINAATPSVLGQISSDPDSADPNYMIDVFRVNMTIRNGIDLTLASTPPPRSVTYRFIIKAAPTGSSTISQSAPFDLSSGGTTDTPLWPLYRAPDGMARYGPRTGPRDTGGDDWCTPWVYRYLLDPNHQAEVVPFNDISGEHGRDIGHSGHKLGTDIDLQNPSPETLPDAITGNENFTALVNYINQASQGNQAATDALRGWVLAARARLGAIMARPEVGQLIYGDRNVPGSLQIDKLLRNGVLRSTSDEVLIDLGLDSPVWGIPLDKFSMYRDHWDHFHVTFDPDQAGQ